MTVHQNESDANTLLANSGNLAEKFKRTILVIGFEMNPDLFTNFKRNASQDEDPSEAYVSNEISINMPVIRIGYGQIYLFSDVCPAALSFQKSLL